MRVQPITIMHSGTHVLRNHVLGQYDPVLAWSKPGSEWVMDFMHVSDTELTQQRLEKADYRFSSLKHPRRIAEGWKRRRENVGDEKKTEVFFIEQFNRLIDEIDPWITAYLHVDHPQYRDTQAARIREIVGITHLEPFDFSLVDKSTGAQQGTHDIDIKSCPRVSERYIQFYYDTLRRRP